MMRKNFVEDTISNHRNLRKILGLLQSIKKNNKLDDIEKICEECNIGEDQEMYNVFCRELMHISNEEEIHNGSGGSNDCAYDHAKDMNSSLSNNSEETNEFDIDSNPSTHEKNKATRIYVDGIFDLSHSGHFNAMRQAKKLGDMVVVGINSDEDALNSKGVIPIYTQEERGALIAGCKWVDEVIIGTKYNVSMELLGKYNCDYAAHGTDIAYDRNGNCCYEEVKKHNRLKIFERSYGISSTTIINHLLQAVNSNAGKAGAIAAEPADVAATVAATDVIAVGDNTSRGKSGEANARVDATYEGNVSKNEPITAEETASTHATGYIPTTNRVNGVGERNNFRKTKTNSKDSEDQFNSVEAGGVESKNKSSEYTANVKHSLSKNKCYVTASQLYQFMENHEKKKSQKVVYVDGSFDIFHIGHLKILENAKKLGDYLLVGMHSDEVVRKMKGKYFPVVSLLERTLNVLAMRVVDDVVIGAPWVITESFIKRFHIDVVVRGTIVDYTYSNYEVDPYAVPKKLNIYRELSSESGITTFEIIERIEKNKKCLMNSISKRKKKEDNIWKVSSSYVLN
ncbi:ethanolamine-phosphate cytidylyltransferase, putative (ECT) [Plasmodium ovale wallikeri]|uniref:ethanolamine-phosphate cytidylyltransferase n=2 Tax=Plasmodium ovale TaxID=36330 RepID=A0A1A8Z8A1_PLAOA|nr:ethanolamine-phosphate cytidylyltransferase, putative (ECT) [Plasmodium ovale wallikeri]SBT40425.1 ethanolamine-phosphate cytidylyltransferase, putative (ECT) [Plasmodium ovale wallikeri]SBT72845.1 ethanolamine-phosphate cytidylyltransferase, putative [Plasmodium ovale]